jgi:hypothetical protein
MSHCVNIKTSFKNINTLLQQFSSRGWEIVNDEKCNTYPSDPRRNEVHKYVAKNPKKGGYDVGIDLDDAGNAYLVCDFFDRSIEEQLGKELKDVKQGYALSEIKKFMYEEDLDYQVKELNTGELVVIAEK